MAPKLRMPLWFRAYEAAYMATETASTPRRFAATRTDTLLVRVTNDESQ